MIRIGAIADVHFSPNSGGRLAPYWRDLHHAVDLFLLGGDLTTHGDVDEIEVLAAELEVVQVPIVAVLGNHDYQVDKPHRVREVLEQKNVRVLEGESTVVAVNGTTVGIAGTKGFGGGFAGACASPFGEPEMKAYIWHTEKLAAQLEAELSALQTDYRIALLHYSPIKETLAGERLEIYPFLGSYLLAEAIDNAGADLIIHGHAHHGAEKGVTARGIPVRNVALPLLKRPYAIYNLEKSHEHGTNRLAESQAKLPEALDPKQVGVEW